MAATAKDTTLEELQATEGHSEATAGIGAIETSLADLWAPSMIALGGVLSVVWTGGLVWLALKLLALM
jgi:hypothetical protein